jgi:hypothetical protein
MPLLDHPAVHDATVQIRSDQPNYSGVANTFLQATNQDVVIDSIEEFLQINVYHHPPT